MCFAEGHILVWLRLLLMAGEAFPGEVAPVHRGDHAGEYQHAVYPGGVQEGCTAGWGTRAGKPWPVHCRKHAGNIRKRGETYYLLTSFTAVLRCFTGFTSGLTHRVL